MTNTYGIATHLLTLTFRVFWLVLPVILFCSSSYAKLFAEDNRQPLNAKQDKQFQAVGRIFAKNHCAATATVTYLRNIITTSAHCFYEDGKLLSKLHNYSFKIWVEGAEKSYRLNSIKVGSRFPARDLGQDWAILKLQEPVPDSILPIGIRPFYDRELRKYRTQITHVGYHSQSTESFIKRISLCRIFIDEHTGNTYQNIFFHDCDTQKAASGSPLMIMHYNRPLLIAIHKGGFKDGIENKFDGINNFNYAVKINDHFFQSLKIFANKT